MTKRRRLPCWLRRSGAGAGSLVLPKSRFFAYDVSERGVLALRCFRTADGSSCFRDKIGLSLVERGTEGKIQSPDEVATILEEPSELGVKAARMRFLLSPESAAAMLRYQVMV